MALPRTHPERCKDFLAKIERPRVGAELRLAAQSPIKNFKVL